MPTRDWRGRSLDDPEWDGDGMGGCTVVLIFAGCVATVAFVLGLVVGRWLG